IYADIYSQILFIRCGEEGFATPKLGLRFSVDTGLLGTDQIHKRALKGIKAWKERCRKSTANSDQLIIMEHLKAVETFLNIMLQMLNPDDCKPLYDLYGMLRDL